MPVWLAAYAGTDSVRGLDVGPLALALLVFQLLPLLIGVALRARMAALADRVHVLARRVADLSLAALILLLLIQSGDELARQGAAVLVAIGLLVGVTLLVGSVPIGGGPVRRATAMTTTVRNLSMALLGARFAAEPEATALVILVYGLAMYLAATAVVVLLRRTRGGAGLTQASSARRRWRASPVQRHSRRESRRPPAKGRTIGALLAVDPVVVSVPAQEAATGATKKWLWTTPYASDVGFMLPP